MKMQRTELAYLKFIVNDVVEWLSELKLHIFQWSNYKLIFANIIMRNQQIVALEWQTYVPLEDWGPKAKLVLL